MKIRFGKCAIAAAIIAVACVVPMWLLAFVGFMEVCRQVVVWLGDDE